MAGTVAPSGAVAQLVERIHGMDEVTGPIPVSSTSFGHTGRSLGFLLGGFVAGEGSFFTSRLPPRRDGRTRTRFVFQVAVATRDRPVLEALREFLGFGSVTDHRPARAHWQPMSSFTIASFRGHYAATIPFAERYLLPSANKAQYERWRDAFLAYDETRARRTRSVCSEPGCEGCVRGRGLCRSHYYRSTGY